MEATARMAESGLPSLTMSRVFDAPIDLAYDRLAALLETLREGVQP